MIFLAKTADRGPLVAAILAAVLLVSALIVPFVLLMVSGGVLFLPAIMLFILLLVCSAAVVSFVALRHGIGSAVNVVAGCGFLLIVASMVMSDSSANVSLFAVTIWMPAVLAAVVLAKTVRLEYAVLTIVFCGVVFVVGLTLILGDPVEFWRSMVFPSDEPGVDGSEIPSRSSGLENLDEGGELIIEGVLHSMTGAVGLLVMSVSLGSLFLARSWQAGLFNPGGFQKEFHALSMGKNVALACIVVIVMSLAQGGQLAIALFYASMFAFFIQGLAVIHALVKQRGMHRLWLNGIYILLLIPYTIFLLAALGLADTVFRLRQA